MAELNGEEENVSMAENGASGIKGKSGIGQNALARTRKSRLNYEVSTGFLECEMREKIAGRICQKHVMNTL